MGLQTATNPDTGETVVFDGKAWQKAEQTAGNDKGEKAYLVNGKWLSDATMPNSAPEEPKRVAATMAGVNRGISGLVGLPVDTAENIVNLGIAGIGTGATALGRPDLAPDLIHGTPGGSESVSGMLNKVGIGTTNPSPQDLASRLLYRGGVVAGGSMVPGARPLPTAASAVGGAVAGEALGEPYTAVGAMAPAAAVQAGQAAKTAIADRVQPRVESFKEVGAQPSVGQATELNFIQGFENLLSKFPGGQGIFRQFAEKQQKQLGANTETGVSAEDAGRAVEKGVQGFIGRTKQTWKELDDQVAQKIPKASTFAPTNTVKALDDLTTPIAGAEKSTGTPLDARIAKIKEDLTADLTGE
jgi:hypothetical protein